jgi:hypothetical protein
LTENCNECDHPISYHHDVELDGIEAGCLFDLKTNSLDHYCHCEKNAEDFKN